MMIFLRYEMERKTLTEVCDDNIVQSDTVNELLDSPITREEIVNKALFFFYFFTTV